MKLAIVGSRTFNDYELLVEHACLFSCACTPVDVDHSGSLIYGKTELEVILGGAKGADILAKKWALANWIQYTEFPADWKKYGITAGFTRNIQIITACDIVLAFWDGESKGTKSSLSLAKAQKKPTFIVYF